MSWRAVLPAVLLGLGPAAAEAPGVAHGGGADPAATPLAIPPEALTDRLARELARAAAEGFVTPADQPRSGAAPAVAVSGENVAIETPFDRLVRRAARPRAPLAGDDGCLPQAALDIAAWGNGDPPARQIGNARRAVYGEFDAPDPAGVRALARLLVHLTFGAEALTLLEIAGLPTPEAALLSELARIVDGAAVPGGALSGQVHCGGQATVLALLADPGLAVPPTQRDSALRAFDAFPGHLRRQLGGALALRFSREGDEQAAGFVANAMLRTMSPQEPAALIVSARMTLQDGVPGELAAVAAGSHPASAEALILHLDAELARGERPSQEMTVLAEALSREQAGSAAAGALERLAVRSRIARGEISVALNRLEALAQPPEASWTRGVNARLLSALAELPDPAIFAATAHDPRLLAVAGQDGGAALHAVAGRLATLGFPDLAGQYRNLARVEPEPPGPLAPAETRGEDERPETAAAAAALRRARAADPLPRDEPVTLADTRALLDEAAAVRDPLERLLNPDAVTEP